MRVIKEERKNYSGYNIKIIIGKNTYTSYWSSPQESIDHAGLEYIKDRYPIIKTTKRMNEFKRLYKNLWIDISDEQERLMKHALGLDYKNKPYRNYFLTNHEDKEWNDLVSKGLAIKSKDEPNQWGSIYFWVSQQGVEYILKKSISDKIYKEL